jgi:hypothetical protein
MSTVIDSFVVELGLDPTKFTRGQQQAYDSAKKLESQQLASAKNIEQSSLRAGDAISGIRTQALSMLAVLTGGKGLLDFSANLTNADAKLGRLERNLGISSQTISKWQGLARIMGGDAASMAQSFTTMSDAFAGWKIGLVTPLIADLRAISTAGGKIIDVNKGVEQSFMDLAENLRNINARDPAQAGLLGRRIGLDPALFDAMISGNLQKVLDYVKKIGVATREDTDAFGELEKRINQIGLKAESLGRKFFNTKINEEDSVASMVTGVADWLNLSPSDAFTAVKERLKKEWGYGPGNPGNGKMFGSYMDSTSQRVPFKSQAEKEEFIRAEAARRGINPNVAMAVAKSEGFNSFQSSVPSARGPNGREDSWGAFQLYKGGGLGNEFQKKTGLDPADPNNERATIQFALDDARKNGWGAFHGAKNTGIGRWAGIDRNAGGNTSTTTVQINGPINVTPPANADATIFADRFAAAVKEQSFAAQANGGQN